MPNLFKFTIIFDGPGHGAQEAWYIQDDSTDLSNALARVAPIIPKRAKLLGVQWSIKAYKVSLIKLTDGTNVARRSRMIKDFTAGNPDEQAAESTISLQVLFQTADGSKQKMSEMVGPWDNLFTSGDALDRGYKGFQTAFNGWISALRTARVGWLGVATKQTAIITGYTFSTVTGRTTYELAAADPGPPPTGITWPVLGQPVRVSVEFPALRSPLDGVQLVIPDDTGLLPITVKPRPAEPFTFNGKMIYETTAFVDWNAPNTQGVTGFVTPQNPMGRKRGRPLLVSHGAKPRIVRW